MHDSPQNANWFPFSVKATLVMIYKVLAPVLAQPCWLPLFETYQCSNHGSHGNNYQPGFEPIGYISHHKIARWIMTCSLFHSDAKLPLVMWHLFSQSHSNTSWRFSQSGAYLFVTFLFLHVLLLIFTPRGVKYSLFRHATVTILVYILGLLI